MSNQRYFIFNADNCIGCYGCAAACKNVNQTDSDELWRSVHKIPPDNGNNNTYYISMSCNHCENPPCLNACPTNSYTKRESDGVVIHNPQTCMGCKYCVMACPYGAIKWNSRLGIVEKCHFCYERLDKGEEPACVKTCFAGALYQIVEDDIENKPLYKKEIEGITYLKKVNPSIRFVVKEQKEKQKREKHFPPSIVINQTGENNNE